VRRMQRWIAATALLALAAPATASAETFDPSQEFKLKDWVPIHLGGLDLSINRAVVYLLVGSATSCVLGLVLMRWRLKPVPDRRQTFGEAVCRRGRSHAGSRTARRSSSTSSS
jgi:hypothetical protein